MPRHSTFEEEFGCIPEQKAIQVANCRYDQIGDFFRQLMLKFAADSAADAGRERPQLAAGLARLSKHMEKAAKEADKVWKLCEPHMSE